MIRQAASSFNGQICSAVSTDGRGRLLVAFFLCGLFFVGAPARAAGTSQKTFNYQYDSVWAAAIGALQARGSAIIHSDKTTGVITTDYKVDQQDDELRYKFNLLLVKRGDSTNVSVSSVVESFEGTGALAPAAWESAQSDDSREGRLLVGIGRRLVSGGAAADDADGNCRSNLAIGGSMVRGSTYSTFVEFAGVSQAAAFDTLSAALKQESFEIVTTDKSAGVLKVVSAEGSDNLNFTVSAVDAGTRIKVVQKYGVGKRGNAVNVADQFCKVISAVSVLVPQAASPSAAVDTKAAGATIEERLKRLEELFKKGLITEEEYKKKRADLLRDL
ncbi:MAG: hypothetical protein QOH21_2689 [Acidobacteriota bacterium]|jgi:hypothetical protein|nr:hypothetical protein [Acidobacteriota bacterium]